MKTSTIEYGVYRIRVLDNKRRFYESLRAGNLVPDEALNYKMFASILPGGAKINPWRYILINASPLISSLDTYALHPGWTEFTGYDETSRLVWNGSASETAGVANDDGMEQEFTLTNESIIGGIGMVGGGDAPAVKGDTAGGGLLLSASTIEGGNKTYPAGFVLVVGCEHRTRRPSS